MEERRRLHHESRPLEWSELVDTQRDAIRSLHFLLAEMGKTIPRSQQQDDRDRDELVKLARITRTRTNRVMLIDGRRGTGKTSVLVTLVDLWSRTARRGAPDHSDDAVKAALGSVAVIPTEIVDLQPLPESAHLMLHVCGHLRRFANLSKTEASVERAIDAPATEKAWEAFARAAAKVWQPSNQRSSRLTPEDLAEEVADVELERLDLNDRFHKLIDALIAELRRHLGIEARPILLVVPIDDVDLNPWRSLEVLELVRWLYHPQVAFVLAGDALVFRDVIHADTLGNLARPFRNVRVEPTEVNELYGTSTIKSLANDIYNKVIPPSHHARIRLLSNSERLERLQSTLRTVEVRIDAPMLRRLGQDAPVNLFEYLRDASLARALPGELRRLLHFAEVLELRKELTLSSAQLSRFLVSDAWFRSDLADETLQAVLDGTSEPRFSMLVAPRHPFPGSGPDRPSFEVLDKSATVLAQLGRDGEVHRLPDQVADGLLLFAEMRSARLGRNSVKLPLCKVVSCRSPLRNRMSSWPLPRFRYHLEQRAFLRHTARLVTECQGDEENFVAWYLATVLQLDSTRKDSVVKQDTHWVLSQAAERFRDGDQTRTCEVVGIAAPEFGLSTKLAAHWLGLAEETFGTDWERFTRILRRRRRQWLGLQRTDRVPSEPTEHPWHQVVEVEITPEIDQFTTILRLGGLEFSQSYLKRLRHLQPLLKNTLKRRLRQSPDPQVRAGFILAEMWRRTTRDVESNAWSVTTGTRGLQVSPPMDPWSDVRSLEAGISLTKGIEIFSLKQGADFPTQSFEAALLPPLIGVIRELAWDIAVNTGAMQQQNAGDWWKPWPGVNVRAEGRQRITHWPAPLLVTHTDIALLCQAWNAICRAVQKVLGVEPGQYLVDRIAHDFIASIVDICTHSVPTRPQYLLSSDAASWRRLAARIEGVEVAQRPDRLRAFGAWRQSWKLFAAPELGLTDEAATTILGGSNGQPPDKAERETLRGVRFQLCTVFGLQPDDRRTDHPWATLVERPDRPKTRHQGS